MIRCLIVNQESGPGDSLDTIISISIRQLVTSVAQVHHWDEVRNVKTQICIIIERPFFFVALPLL